MGTLQLYILAAVAGFTILLGLPVALIPRIDVKVRGFLNALSVGVLIYLLMEVSGKALQTAAGALIDSNIGRISWYAGLGYAVLLLGGFSASLMSLVIFEKLYIRTAKDECAPRDQAIRLAMMIAIGIGLHNFGEGLAIGQEYTQGALSLALVLIVGFGIHNATEGFGIAAPLCGVRPSLPMLGLMGLVGGGPTFLGTIVGSLWTSKPVEILFLSLASGSILYVVAELIHIGRRQGVHEILMVGLLVGFFVAFGSELIIEMNSLEAGEYPSTVARAGPRQKPSISAGRGVFQQNCAVCHGIRADGHGPAASGLARPPRDFTNMNFDALENNLDWFDAITYGRGKYMPAWKDRLSEADRWNVIAYLRSLNMTP